jgi:hypothetical protein
LVRVEGHCITDITIATTFLNDHNGRSVGVNETRVLPEFSQLGGAFRQNGDHQNGAMHAKVRVCQFGEDESGEKKQGEN